MYTSPSGAVPCAEAGGAAVGVGLGYSFHGALCGLFGGVLPANLVPLLVESEAFGFFRILGHWIILEKTMKLCTIMGDKGIWHYISFARCVN